MATKPELPSALEELEQPRPDLRGLRPRDAMPDSAIEANSRTIGAQWKANTRLPDPEPQTPIAKMRVDIPDYVFQQVKRRAFEEGATQSYYLLKGLAAIGFQVNDVDLVLDRRKRNLR
jgi:hypothetical protein